MITTIAGNSFAQVGGLVVIEPKTTAVASLSFQRDLTQSQSLLILKQPGLPDTHYTVIRASGEIQQFVLDNDFEVAYD